jgi:hypothetical protein
MSPPPGDDAGGEIGASCEAPGGRWGYARAMRTLALLFALTAAACGTKKPPAPTSPSGASTGTTATPATEEKETPKDDAQRAKPPGAAGDPCMGGE